MENLTRYECETKALGNLFVGVMRRRKNGLYVKFDDIKEFLPSASTNKRKGEIPLASPCYWCTNCGSDECASCGPDEQWWYYRP